MSQGRGVVYPLWLHAESSELGGWKDGLDLLRASAMKYGSGAVSGGRDVAFCQRAPAVLPYICWSHLCLSFSAYQKIKSFKQRLMRLTDVAEGRRITGDVIPSVTHPTCKTASCRVNFARKTV